MFRYRKGLKTKGEIETAISEILSEMTIDEKVGQLCQSVGADIVAIGSTTVHENIEELTRKGLIGSMIKVDEPAALYEKTKHLQEIAVNESRLGIPLIFAQDVIHGFETVFPIPLSSSCSFDPALIEDVVHISGKEAGSCGIAMAFSPMVDISRNPHWGRVAEGAGEDPFLGSAVARSYVRGFKRSGTLSCLKHFCGYGAAEAGRDYNTVHIDDSELYNTYLRPFKAGIDEGADSIMTSFNTMNGIPMTANRHMLTDVLRGQLGFGGFVISDYSAVMELMNHRVAENEEEAIRKAFDAGLDIEMTTSYFRQYLPSLIERGIFSIEKLDEAVRRVLRAKYNAGLMDDPFRFHDRDYLENGIYSNENRALSLRLAQESAVLLENDGILPLSKEKKVALIGPLSNSTDLSGCWSFSHQRDKAETVCEAFRKAGYTVTSTPACDIEASLDGGRENAVRAAENADVAVLAVGESNVLSGEACSRMDITIPSAQREIIDAVLQVGKPVVLLIMSGRPLLLSTYKDKVNAMLFAFQLGSMSAEALVNIISGKVNPSGHLSMSFPYEDGQIPVYYNELPTGRPYVPQSGEHFQSKYLDGPNEPLYPFGYGLSYTTFDIENVIRDGLTLKVKVANTGSCDGTALVQIYLHDLYSSVSRPVKELCAFKRVELGKGEKKTVEIEIAKESLGFRLPDGTFTYEDGSFDIFVGFSSADIRKTLTLKLTKGEVR